MPGEGLVLEVSSLDVSNLRVVPGAPEAVLDVAADLQQADDGDVGLLEALARAELEWTSSLTLAADTDLSRAVAEAEVVEPELEPAGANVQPGSEAAVHASLPEADAGMPAEEADADLAALMEALRAVEESEEAAAPPHEPPVAAPDVPAVVEATSPTPVDVEAGVRVEAPAAPTATEVAAATLAAAAPLVSVAAAGPEKRRRARTRGRRKPAPQPPPAEAVAASPPLTVASPPDPPRGACGARGGTSRSTAVRHV